jgi:CBS domain containing-hemolysin-like protein
MSFLVIMLVCSLFFLIWAFFLAITTHLLPKLTEKGVFEIITNEPRRFFYFTLHRWLFGTNLYDLLILASSLGANAARVLFVSFATFALYTLVPTPLYFVLGFILIFVIALLICDLIARLIAFTGSPHFFHRFLFSISLFLTLSLPFQFLILKFIQHKKKHLSKEHIEDRVEKFRQTISDIMQAADLSGPLNSSDKKLLESVLKFKDRIVREVMVPRSELFALPTTTTLKEAAIKLTHEGFSRIPIYRGNIDNIIGILMFKDLFEIYHDCLEGKKDLSILQQPVGGFLKGVIYTPETKQVSQLLQEFRAKQMHMAIAVDEYGGTEGVVTIEDILEEIVGDISDEYDLDHEALYVPQPGGGVWIVDAKMSIFDAENIFNIHIPKEGDYDTIGGFIFHKLNALPEPKTKIVCEEFELEILSVTERNIEKVRLISKESTGTTSD